MCIWPILATFICFLSLHPFPPLDYPLLVFLLLLFYHLKGSVWPPGTIWRITRCSREGRPSFSDKTFGNCAQPPSSNQLLSLPKPKLKLGFWQIQALVAVSWGFGHDHLMWPQQALLVPLVKQAAASGGLLCPVTHPSHPGPVTSQPLQHDLYKGASLILF